MKRQSDSDHAGERPAPEDFSELRDRLIGLGERSIRKSYYPELKERLGELERFRALLDHTSDAILLLELETGRLADMNLAASAMLGSPREGLLGKTVEQVLPAELAAGVKHRLGRLAAGVTVEAMLPRLNGAAGEAPVPVEVSVRVAPFGGVPYVVLVARDITERKRAERRVRDSLREKEVMLKEIHHRVKNNLQVISSLLNLQAVTVTDPRSLELFRESQHRIQSMALVHENLYRSRDLANVDFAEYIESITTYLTQAYDVRPVIRLERQIQDGRMPVNTAIPCGLIVNELVSNSLKYAFPDNRPGRVAVSLRKADGRFLLEVEDDGIGLPGGHDIMNSGTLGLKLVYTLARQLRGRIEHENESGARFRIDFPG